MSELILFITQAMILIYGVIILLVLLVAARKVMEELLK
jgi:hypothetical protein